MKYRLSMFLILGLVLLSACDQAPEETAAEFVARAEIEGNELGKELSAAFWVRNTYITPDTAILAAKAGERGLEFESRMVNQAKQYKDTAMDPQTARAIELMLRGSSAPAPNDAAMRAELSAILTDMEGQYGAGKYCNEAGECKELQALESVLAQSRDYDELLDVWQGWRRCRPLTGRSISALSRSLIRVLETLAIKT